MKKEAKASSSPTPLSLLSIAFGYVSVREFVYTDVRSVGERERQRKSDRFTRTAWIANDKRETR